MPSSSFAVRITRPYSDLSGMFHTWAMQCEKLVVYEHVGTETELVHVHALVLGLRVTKVRLKQLTEVPGRPLLGNQDWAFKKANETTDKYVTYMSKGRHNPCYVLGFEMDYLNQMKSLWRDPKQLPPKNAKLHQDFRNHVYTKWNHATGEIFPNVSPEIYELYGAGFDRNKYVFDKLRNISYYYAMSHLGEYNVRTMNMAKTLLLTYARDHGIEPDLKALFKF